MPRKPNSVTAPKTAQAKATATAKATGGRASQPLKPDPYGTHRVLEPAGSLPQAAKRLDNRPEPY
ncbi:MAG: hypothetical protein ACYC6V_07905, partial [Bacillota bacterium]